MYIIFIILKVPEIKHHHVLGVKFYRFNRKLYVFLLKFLLFGILGS